MAEVKCEITKHIGVLSKSAKGWTKEFNIVSWNEREPKYDIREWAPEHDRMGKGITLSKDEVAALKSFIDEMSGISEDDNRKRVYARHDRKQPAQLAVENYC